MKNILTFAMVLVFLVFLAQAETPPTLDGCYRDDKTGLYFYWTKDDRCGLMKKNGLRLLEPILAKHTRVVDPYVFEEGYAGVQGENGLWGFIDTRGNIVIPFTYDRVSEFEYGLANVWSGDEQYVIDTTGARLLTLPLSFDVEIVSENEVHAEDDIVEYYERTPDGFTLAQEITSSFDITEYYPNEGAKVATLDEAVQSPHWAYDGAPLPRIDGATALFPVYSAIVQAIYPATTRYGDGITCSRTDGAYENLISGDADVIFVAGPSDAQLEMAAEEGVEFEMTPIGREAFVFIVNRENPLTEITLDEIRDIYSGRTTNWEALGVENLGSIVAFQRPKNSGSQTALEKLMQGDTLMEAPTEDVGEDMFDMIVLVEYRNLTNAIGYSFRFYVTDLMNSSVTLLSVDGVSPTVENIRSGAYPLNTQLYAVTRKGETNPNVQVLLDWVTSDQGMALIEKAGYVAEK